MRKKKVYTEQGLLETISAPKSEDEILRVFGRAAGVPEGKEMEKFINEVKQRVTVTKKKTENYENF